MPIRDKRIINTRNPSSTPAHLLYRSPPDSPTPISLRGSAYQCSKQSYFRCSATLPARNSRNTATCARISPSGRQTRDSDGHRSCPQHFQRDAISALHRMLNFVVLFRQNLLPFLGTLQHSREVAAPTMRRKLIRIILALDIRSDEPSQRLARRASLDRAKIIPRPFQIRLFR